MMSLSDFFTAGGPGMYFHLVTGLLCIGFAVQLGRAPSPRLARVTWGLAAVTLLHGLANWAQGMVLCLGGASQSPEPLRIVLAGSSEALTNLVLALLLVMFAALAWTLAAGLRGGRAAAAPARGSDGRAAEA